MKRFRKNLSLLLLAILLTASGCAAENSPTTGAVQEGGTSGQETSEIQAMVLTDEQGHLYFAVTDEDLLFTVSEPQVQDPNGDPISLSSLGAGDLVKVFGNGLFLETYPCQYPGASRIQLLEEGDAADAAPYAHMLEPIRQETEPYSIPVMHAEYEDAGTVTAVLLVQGGYQWEYTDQDGLSQSVIACASHILEWETLHEARIPEGTPVTLVSSYPPQSVSVTRFPASLRNDPAETDAASRGEAVETIQTEDGFLIPAADPGYLYLVSAQWPEGSVEYGFLASAP